MSADRISICPKCNEKHKDWSDNELRENYTIHLRTDFVLEIHYYCICYNCDWSYCYKKKIKIE